MNQEHESEMRVKVAVIEANTEHIRRDIADINTKIDKMSTNFVTRAEHTDLAETIKVHSKTLEEMSDFPIIKKLVFGAVSLILLSVVTSIIYLVVEK